MKAHVICMNDSIKFVVVGDIKKANDIMEDLKHEWYNIKYFKTFKFDRYEKILNWHIKTVDCNIGD